LRRVGFNLMFLVPGQTGGMEIYASSLVPKLCAERPDLEFVAFVSAEAADIDLGPVQVVDAGVSGSARIRRILAEQRRLPRLVRRHGIDLLHSLGSSAPRHAGAVSVVTIHDVIYARFPEAHTLAMRMGQRIVIPSAARSADRVITPSAASADEITEQLGIPRERIDVIHEAGKPPGPASPEPELRRKFALGEAPVVLSVSSRRPHKNVPRLMEAFARVEVDPPPMLAIPGYETSFEDDVQRRATELGIAERVRFLGWLRDDDLEGLYSLAECFVFPSLAEGFGLPVLEAMQRGLPVACSFAGPLPEVGGDAVKYFDPLDPAAIASALTELLSRREIRQELAAAGRTRAKLFEWSKTARETAESYERALAEAT
jgi:glycosyltransferase involved in cell wall biosynthesis